MVATRRAAAITVSLLAAATSSSAQEPTPAASASPAQATPSSGGTASNPLIPSGISQTCSSFLAALNNDRSIASCSAPLLSATSAFAAGNSSSVDSATLSTLCSNSSTAGCDADVVRTSLSYFAGNCSAELQAGNELVVSNYDVLYVLLPLHQAVCSIDPATNAYCALSVGEKSSVAANPSAVNSSVPRPSQDLSHQLSGNVTAASPSAFANGTAAAVQFAVQNAVKAFDLSDLYYTVSSSAKSLLKRQIGGNVTSSPTTPNATVDPAAAVLPNATTFRNSYLPFLFLNPNQTSAELCTPCTKNILAAYVSWETSSVHALGLAHSPLLGNQAKLWRALGNACGSGFLQSVEEKAGTTGLVLGAASHASISAIGLILAAFFTTAMNLP